MTMTMKNSNGGGAPQMAPPPNHCKCAMSTVIFRMTNAHDARPHNGTMMTTPPPPLMLTDHKQCPCSTSTQPRWVNTPGTPYDPFWYGNQVPHCCQWRGNWTMNDDIWSSLVIVVYTTTQWWVVFTSLVQSGFLPPKWAIMNCNQSRNDPDIVGTELDHLGPVFCGPWNWFRPVQTGFFCIKFIVPI